MLKLRGFGAVFIFTGFGWLIALSGTISVLGQPAIHRVFEICFFFFFLLCKLYRRDDQSYDDLYSLSDTHRLLRPKNRVALITFNIMSSSQQSLNGTDEDFHDFEIQLPQNTLALVLKSPSLHSLWNLPLPDEIMLPLSSSSRNEKLRNRIVTTKDQQLYFKHASPLMDPDSP